MDRQTLLAKLDQMKVDYAFYYSDKQSRPILSGNHTSFPICFDH